MKSSLFSGLSFFEHQEHSVNAGSYEEHTLPDYYQRTQWTTVTKASALMGSNWLLLLIRRRRRDLQMICISVNCIDNTNSRTTRSLIFCISVVPNVKFFSIFSWGFLEKNFNPPLYDISVAIKPAVKITRFTTFWIWKVLILNGFILAKGSMIMLSVSGEWPCRPI